MRFRSALLGNVLSLAFLNLFVLGVAFLLLVRHESRLDLNSFLLAPAHDRILAAMRLLALQLGQSEAAGWDAQIAAYATANGVAPRIVDDRGAVIAGDRTPLPAPVLERFLARHQANDRGRGRRGRFRGDDNPGHREAEYDLAFLGSVSGAVWVAAATPMPHDAEPPGDRHSWIVLASTGNDDLFYVDTRPWIVVGCAVILISIVCWLPFVRGLTRSISRMTAATAQVAEGHFNLPLTESRRDELGDLAGSINRMASRLDRFVNGQKRFLRDAAHELRSPLARMQIGLGLLDRSAAETQRQALADLREDVEQMGVLVDDVLAFSRTAAHAVQAKIGDVPLNALVRRVIDREGQSADIRVSVPTELAARADPDLLFRALSNVVRNAIRYAGAAGPIDIAASADDESILLSVADCGPGVPDPELEAIFDPFYRLQTARERSSGGVGLGLAIVKSAVESCGGAVAASSRRPSGLKIEFRLKNAQRWASGKPPESSGGVNSARTIGGA